MAFIQHIKLTAIGTIGTSAGETFSYGFNLAQELGGVNPGEFSDIPDQNIDDLCDSVRDFHARAETTIHSACRLKMVKLAVIAPDGSYVDPGAMVFREYDVAGGGANGFVTPQNALAITLDTARPGPTGRGRFFIPMPCCSLDAGTMLISAAYANDIRDSAATMLNDINNSPGLDLTSGSVRVCVASRTGHNSFVTGVRVGRVIDTMRSRRRSIGEAYTAEAAIS